jgi:hypothetical protein
LVVTGAGVAGAVVLCGFAFAFVAAAAGAGADVAVTSGEATMDARAEVLAAGDVLPAGEALPPPSAIPMMTSRANPATAIPTLCSFLH